jgi:hypothetical protein
MDEYAGFAEYFHSSQKWFYGLLGALFLADLVDTAIKEHFSSFGVSYPIRQGVLFVLAMAATAIADRRYHATFVIIAIASEVFWILSQFQVLE